MTDLEMIIVHLNHRTFPPPTYRFVDYVNCSAIIEVGIYKDVKFLYELLRFGNHNKKLSKIKSK